MEGLKLVPQLQKYTDGCNGCAYENWPTSECPQTADKLLCTDASTFPYGAIWIKDESYQPIEQTHTGTKHDSNKPRFDLVPPDALTAVTRVITYGENKYPSINGVQNWRLLDNVNQRLFAAAQRHLWAYQAGEKLDESGENHLAHAISSLMFMLQLDIENMKE